MADSGDLPGDRIEQVLTVVEHEQQSSRRQMLEHHVLEAAASKGLQPQRCAERLPHRIRIRDRRELTQPRAVREVGDDLRRDVQRQARLADAADAGQGYQRRLPHQIGERADLGLAADERRDLTRQIAGQRIQRTQRRELRTQLRQIHLEHTHRRLQIAQPVLAQVDEVDTFGQLPKYQRRRGTRDHQLPAVRHRHQPRAPVQRVALVLITDDSALSGV